MIQQRNDLMSDFILSSRFRVFRHLLLLLGIVVLTMNVFWNENNQFVFSVVRFCAWSIYFLLVMALLYLNIYVLVPRFLIKDKLYTYLFCASISTCVTHLLVIILQEFILSREIGAQLYQVLSMPRVVLGLIDSFMMFGFVVAGTSALTLFRHWILNDQRISDLETSTSETELKFLKNQINPHFLFNMLNNANMLVKKNPQMASEVLVKLEDLLRYQINDTSREEVPLCSDIHFLNDFLDLEKVRRDQFDFSITQEGEVDSIQLPPLLFIPFVENAVKHNPDSEYISYVYLSFRVDGQQLYFRCENSKPATAAEKASIGGLGLKNIQRRLKLLYPDRHVLEILDDEKSYTVNLHLEL